MAENSNNSPRGNKPVRIKFNISWIYFILLLAIGWMFFNQEGANPQKIEWDEVKKLWLADDIKEVIYIRNEYEGHVTVKPDRLEKYADKSAYKNNAGWLRPTQANRYLDLAHIHRLVEKEFSNKTCNTCAESGK